MKAIIAALVVIAFIGVAVSTPLDAVKATGDVNHAVVDVQNVNTSVFDDESFEDDIGNNSAYNSSITDVSVAWEASIKE